MEDHELPSEEDLARFSDVTRTCPHCKEDVFDDAELCYHCGEALVQAERPLPIWVVAAGLLVVAGMLMMILR